jgi:hypothetical protein
MEAEMARHGWRVIDRPKKTAEEAQRHLIETHNEAALLADGSYRRGGAEGVGQGVPWLVYHHKSPNTVNTIKSMLSTGTVNPAFVCALLENEEGSAGLRALEEEYACQMPSVCSSVTYDRVS